MAKRNKRGFSITEVIIAMAIIAVVSFAAVSVLTLSSTTINNSRLSIYASNDSYNLLECFKMSQDFQQFDSAASFLGYNLQRTDGGYYLVKNYDYVYVIKVSVDFEKGSFYAFSYNTETDKEICSVTYYKG